MSGQNGNPGWWRRQGLYLLGAAVFGIWALYEPYLDAWHQRARLSPLVPIEVARGAWVTFAGARWRMVEVTMRTHPNLATEAAIVVARFETVTESGVDPKKLARCKGQIRDSSGRVWGHDALLRPAAEREPDVCIGGLGPGQNGSSIDLALRQPWRFEFTFLVPNGLDVHDLHPEISIPWDDENVTGRYLRFNP